jgi:hypothetical protein
LLVVLGRYYTTVHRFARAQLRAIRRSAASIPDPRLRRLALEKLSAEGLTLGDGSRTPSWSRAPSARASARASSVPAQQNGHRDTPLAWPDRRPRRRCLTLAGDSGPAFVATCSGTARSRGPLAPVVWAEYVDDVVEGGAAAAPDPVVGSYASAQRALPALTAQTFADPPREARPAYRWFWLRPAIDGETIDRSIGAVAEAGAGHVEIGWTRAGATHAREQQANLWYIDRSSGR